MAGLHMLSHNDDKNHPSDCTTCDYVISHNITPTLPFNIIDYTFKEIKYGIQIEKLENYNFLISSTIASNQLFSRPPPF
ncbi:hypothetical protein [Tenacibaculum aestuariivivum]|uniref:hypothetical protein n=1 Tax=Tenacibaculum aestuariivivum TaxID=2006131 RepID=UPI003AB152C7